jgi:hypothetical protein
MRTTIGGVDVYLAPDALPEFSYALSDVINGTVKVSGSSSTTFDIPASNSARQALGGPAMNEQTGGDFPIRIGEGSQVLFDGICTPVEWSEDRVSVAAFGDNAAWINDAKNTKCNTVDLGNSQFVENSMQQASWSDENRADVYPLIDYGSLRDHTSTTNVIEDQLYPAVRIWLLLSKFFGDRGFSIKATGAFATIWKKLIIPYNGGAIRFRGAYNPTNSVRVSATASGAGVTTTTGLPFDTEDTDPSSYMDPSGGFQRLFTPDISGTWAIEINGTITLVRTPGTFVPPYGFLSLYMDDPSLSIGRRLVERRRYNNLWNGPSLEASVTLSGIQFSAQMQQGETYWVTFEPGFAISGFVTVRVEEGTTMGLNLTGYSGWQDSITFDIAGSIDKSLTVADVVSSLSNIFRLAIRTDQLTNTIEIGYLRDYLQDVQTGIDWSDRIDHSTLPQKVQPEVPVRYVFKYTDDNTDQKLIDYANANDQELGTGVYESGGRDEERTIEVKFAPTQEGPRFDGIFIPVIDGEDTPVLTDFVETKPRILIFDGPTNGDWTFDGVLLRTFPRAYFLGSGASDVCLSFGSDWRQGTVDAFWSEYLDRASKPYLKAELRLYDDEFMNFSFGKPRLVHDGYMPLWMYVSKVKGKRFGSDEPIECELIPL